MSTWPAISMPVTAFFANNFAENLVLDALSHVSVFSDKFSPFCVRPLSLVLSLAYGQTSFQIASLKRGAWATMATHARIPPIKKPEELTLLAISSNARAGNF